MFRAPIWRMSAYSATMSPWAGSMTSGMTGRPVASRASGRARPAPAGAAPQPAHGLALPRPDPAHHRKHRPRLAGVLVRRQPLGQDPALDAQDLGLAGGGGHHDEHALGDLGSGAGASPATKNQRASSPCLAPTRPAP